MPLAFFLSVRYTGSVEELQKVTIATGVIPAISNRGHETTEDEIRSLVLEPGGIKVPLGPIDLIYVRILKSGQQVGIYVQLDSDLGRVVHKVVPWKSLFDG